MARRPLCAYMCGCRCNDVVGYVEVMHMSVARASMVGSAVEGCCVLMSCFVASFTMCFQVYCFEFISIGCSNVFWTSHM